MDVNGCNSGDGTASSSSCYGDSEVVINKFGSYKKYNENMNNCF